MDISLVIPLLNEEASLNELHSWIVKVMNQNNFSYEIIFIDDGSTDKSWEIVTRLTSENQNVKALKFRRNYGKSAALFVGFDAAKANVVITMDADLQDSPDEIPILYKMIVDEEFDLISGWKKIRHDPFSKTFPSKIFNGTASIISGLKLHDFNCGLKAYRLDVVKSIEVYGEMHRYIPILVKKAGFNKIGEKVVTHYERKYGNSKFGAERLMKGYLDLLSITFITKFGKRPMHLFGTLGTLMFITGGIISSLIIIKKIIHLWNHLPVREATDQPLFYIALAMAVIGVQLFLAGFLGELISRNSTERNKYVVEKRLNLKENN